MPNLLNQNQKSLRNNNEAFLKLCKLLIVNQDYKTFLVTIPSLDNCTLTINV